MPHNKRGKAGKQGITFRLSETERQKYEVERYRNSRKELLRINELLIVSHKNVNASLNRMLDAIEEKSDIDAIWTETKRKSQNYNIKISKKKNGAMKTSVAMIDIDRRRKEAQIKLDMASELVNQHKKQYRKLSSEVHSAKSHCDELWWNLCKYLQSEIYREDIEEQNIIHDLIVTMRTNGTSRSGVPVFTYEFSFPL
jgi:rubrerythrin